MHNYLDIDDFVAYNCLVIVFPLFLKSIFFRFDGRRSLKYQKNRFCSSSPVNLPKKIYRYLVLISKAGLLCQIVCHMSLTNTSKIEKNRRQGKLYIAKLLITNLYSLKMANCRCFLELYQIATERFSAANDFLSFPSNMQKKNFRSLITNLSKLNKLKWKLCAFLKHILPGYRSIRGKINFKIVH